VASVESQSTGPQINCEFQKHFLPRVRGLSPGAAARHVGSTHQHQVAMRLVTTCTDEKTSPSCTDQKKLQEAHLSSPFFLVLLNLPVPISPGRSIRFLWEKTKKIETQHCTSLAEDCRPLHPSFVSFVPLFQTKRVFRISTRTRPRAFLTSKIIWHTKPGTE